MSLEDYEAFVYAACHVDEENPADHWRAVAQRARRRARRARLDPRAAGSSARTPTSGSASPAGRGSRPRAASTCRTARSLRARSKPRPRARSASRSRRPSRAARSRTCACGSKPAASSSASAARGDEYLRSLLDMDEGARVAGEIAFGLNYEIDRFTHNILFDEKIGGTIHLALGAAFTQAGGKNTSGLHWDLICDLRERRRGLRGRRARLARRRVPRGARAGERLVTAASIGSPSVLVDYSTEVQPGQLVLVESPPAAAPLVRAIYARCSRPAGSRRRGSRWTARPSSCSSEASDAQLDWVSPARAEDYERADVRIVLEASANTRALTNVEPASLARVSRAREPLRTRYLERAAAGELRWTITLFPTNAAAQDAEMSLAEYERFVYGAGKLDADDPVGEWRAFGDDLRRLADWLGAKQELRVVSNGTDLTVGVDGRTWIPCDGKRELPRRRGLHGPGRDQRRGRDPLQLPGELPGAAGGGHPPAVLAAARSSRRRPGAARTSWTEMLALDDGARRVGEFAFGMNDAITEFTKNTLFDEKIGGTVHLALGKAYPESGGKNQSALHWDLVCDLRSGSEVYADGELVYRDGRFLRGVL